MGGSVGHRDAVAWWCSARRRGAQWYHLACRTTAHPVSGCLVGHDGAVGRQDTSVAVTLLRAAMKRSIEVLCGTPWRVMQWHLAL